LILFLSFVEQHKLG